MSHDLSRKHFVAKGLGLLALVGIAPKLRAFSASPAAAQARVSSLRSGGVQRSATARNQALPQVRVEPRAVAHGDISTAASSSPAATASSFRN
ncbi:hypothetical protein [Cephaloticoccus capnophilus]|uniref:hypothetical protein n=1 Tax=Cephaloticoccus capnophilus TaxID=1548208 RepID=UPI0012E956CE|nr:hypothetical protein [Cephaloticoccus capnophilus]